MVIGKCFNRTDILSRSRLIPRIQNVCNGSLSVLFLSCRYGRLQCGHSMCCGNSCCDVCSRQAVWSILYCHCYLYSFQYNFYIVYRVCTKGKSLRKIKLQDVSMAVKRLAVQFHTVQKMLVSPSVCRSTSSSVLQPVSQSVSQSIRQTNRQTARLFVCLSVSQSVSE